MIPLPILPTRTIVIAAVVAIAVLGVIANTYRLSAAVDREHAALVTCKSDNDKLKLAIDDQNRSIDALKSAASHLSDAAAKAIAEAEKFDESRRKAVSDLENWKRRPNESECDATRRLLLEYPR